MKNFLVVMAAILLSMSMSAQQNISFREGKLVSPEVNNDRTVTFRLNAPKAKNVRVLADWEQNMIEVGCVHHGVLIHDAKVADALAMFCKFMGIEAVRGA